MEFARKISEARKAAGVPYQPQTRARRGPSDDGVAVPGLPTRIWVPHSNPAHDSTSSSVPQAADPNGGVRAATWYSLPCVEELEKAATARAVDCHGKAGTVVFYHASLAHQAGENYGQKIRQGVLTGWGVSEAAMPEDKKLDHVLRNDLWLDWSDGVRSIKSEPAVPRPARLDQEIRL